MKHIFEKILDTVNENRTLILDTQNYIWAHPETGYREWNTSRYLQDIFENLGYELTMAGDIPGFYTVIDTGRPGPEVLILGELDSLICADHPDADPDTGAVHCCGHSAQCAALVGVAAALKEERILSTLCGRIRLCVVPAEELIEMDFRKSLKEQGIIHHFGGKPEFLRRGYFDGVDLAFMVHTTTNPNFFVNSGGVGCLAKTITYKGVAAHAGGSPWNGVNALYAANLGLNAINAIRETFKEPDIIRVHPIITTGGQAVNAIPEKTVIETYVRGSSFAAIAEASKKVNRALTGAALSLGANVDIEDVPGYAPYINNADMVALAGDALSEILPGKRFQHSGVISSGSTDMGDLGCIMPMMHPYAPGAVGTAHGADYFIQDPESACVQSAQWQLAFLYKLLENGGEKARQIMADYKPQFTSAKDYIDYLDSMENSGDRIDYQADGNAVVTLA